MRATSWPVSSDTRPLWPRAQVDEIVLSYTFFKARDSAEVDRALTAHSILRKQQAELEAARAVADQ
eukprot:m.152845 g.152845  ORF g.152845 m.152845 type:complete len:66 (-) comp10170_c0_seq8:1852-2049(-)